MIYNKKSLGQNFLIDSNIKRKIVNSVNIKNKDVTILDTLNSLPHTDNTEFRCDLHPKWSFSGKYISDDKRFKLFKQTNHGVVAARNFGIRKSVNRYITFLDADDIWDQDFLMASLNFRKEHGKPLAITHAAYFRFKVKDNKINSSLVKPPLIINHKNILKKNFMPLLTVLIDRDLINGFYFENQRPEDYRLWIQLIYIKKFESISIKKALGFYRISNNQRSKNKFKNLIRIFKFFSELPNTNFFEKIFHTLNWILHNSLQRIFSKKIKNEEKLEYLSSILIKYK